MAHPCAGLSGVTGAAPILHELVEHLHQRFGTSWYPDSPEMALVRVHPLTGKRRASPPLAPDQVYVEEKCLSHGLPPLETPGDYDPAGRVILPTEYGDWLGHAGAGLEGVCLAEPSPDTLRITFPMPGTVLYLDPDLPFSGGRIRPKADGSQSVAWSSDTLRVEREDRQTLVYLTPGNHRLTASDPRTGARMQTAFEVQRR